jgi:long-chain acyl-CoA synthetase
VAVAVNAWLMEDALSYCITSTGTKVVFADPERASRLAPKLAELKTKGVKGVMVTRSGAKRFDGMTRYEEVVKKYTSKTEYPEVDVGPEDNAVIFFTSGTSLFVPPPVMYGPLKRFNTS